MHMWRKKANVPAHRPVTAMSLREPNTRSRPCRPRRVIQANSGTVPSRPVSARKRKKKECGSMRRELSWTHSLMVHACGKVPSPVPAHGCSRNRCCLLYTSDAADDLLCVDLGGRRIIKKKKN